MKQKGEVNSENTKPAIDTHTFSADKNGPKILFFGAIHGDEPCGPKALRKLVGQFSTGELKVLKGSVTLVPVCNPKAFELKERIYQENLNRVFTHHDDPATYEARVANVLVPLVEQCDMLIDLHSASAQSDPFVFLDYQMDAYRQLVEATGIANVLEGWAEVYQKVRENEPQKPTDDTASFAHAKGKVSATVECGSHLSDTAEHIAYGTVLNVLRYFGMVAGGSQGGRVEQKRFRLEKLYYKDSEGGVLKKAWKNFEPVSCGEVIAEREDRTPAVSAPFDGYVVLPKQDAKEGQEWFYLARLE